MDKENKLTIILTWTFTILSVIAGFFYVLLVLASLPHQGITFTQYLMPSLIIMSPILLLLITIVVYGSTQNWRLSKQTKKLHKKIAWTLIIGGILPTLLPLLFGFPINAYKFTSLYLGIIPTVIFGFVLFRNSA